MNKEEFYKKLDTYKDEKGEYSEIALLCIGKEFRKLPVKQRNWKELISHLGINKSPDSFRQWIYKNEDLVEELVSEITTDTTNQIANASITNESDEEVEMSSYANEYKMLTRNRDVLNSYRRLLRDEARIDSLKDCIKEVVKDLKVLPELKNQFDDLVTTNNEAVMLLSDLHIGVDCDNFYNKYNSTIAAARLDKYVNDTVAYCKLMNIRRLNVLNLGDMIHGLIHTTSRIEQEFDVVTQIIIASELLAKALNKLQYAAPEVIYRSVTDNHSRSIANLKENIENENFYRLIDWYVEERLKDSKIIFDKKANLDPSFVYFELLNGQTACAAHGHLDNINTSVQNFSGLTHTFVDNIFLAHYHEEKVKNFRSATVFVNGSIVGPEQYAISKRLVGVASQKLIIYCESSRIDISIKLN
jgi:hypothetical protein